MIKCFWINKRQSSDGESRQTANEGRKSLQTSNKEHFNKYSDLRKTLAQHISRQLTGDEVVQVREPMCTCGMPGETIRRYMRRPISSVELAQYGAYLGLGKCEEFSQPSEVTPKSVSNHEVAELTPDALFIPLRDKAFLSLLVSSGCRSSELLGLRIPDIDLENRTATVTGKGNKIRKVHFSKQSAQLLTEYLTGRPDGKGAVFPNKSDTQLSPAAVDRIIDKMRKMSSRDVN